MTDRLPPIQPEQQTPAQRQAVAEIIAGPRGRLQGPFVALLRAPELMQRVQALGEQLRFRCVLGERLKELAILLVARKWAQQTEWILHRPMALAAGIAPGTADAIAEGRRPPALDADEAIVYDFCAELLASSFQVSDGVWQRACGRFGEQGVVELIGLCGYYTLLAMVMNAAQTALPAGAQPALRPLGEL
jgi:4-carboxymuconolactone decarboxylase